MRIKMIEPRRTTIDGVDLSLFHPGQAYEVDPSVANYLILSGVAEPCGSDSPALVVRTSEVMVGVFRGGAATTAEVADDWEDDDGPGAA
jgi:hypothetical protein